MQQALTEAYIRDKAAEMGFTAAYCVTPETSDGAPEDCRTLILLARAYQPGGTLADAFYPAKNIAYHQATAFVQALCACGIQACYLPHVRVKPICARIPAFTQGRNTLNYLADTGSRFCMELIGCADKIAVSYNKLNQCINKCDQCTICTNACPTGAISKTGFSRDKCLRNYMLGGKPVPEIYRALMGVRDGAKAIIGCDICQRVCPMNRETWARTRAIEENNNSNKQATENAFISDTEAISKDAFALDELIQCDNATLNRFAQTYGANYALKNRILAQAALAAGNTGDVRYLPQLEALACSESAAVREHAQWAIARLKNV